MKNSAFIFLCLILIPAAHAQLYKWYDKQGNIHYSQFPPDEKEGKKDVYIIEKSAGKYKLKPVLDRGRLYCGKLQLPWHGFSQELIIENITLGLKDWIQQEIDSRDQLRNISKTGTSQKNNIKLKKQHAEYQCRATWAKNILDFRNSRQFKINYELQSLETEYRQLKYERDNKCPNSADFYNKGWLVGKEAQDHQACQDKYNKKITPIEQKIRRYRNKYKPFQANKR